jgi:hypothetical protein
MSYSGYAFFFLSVAVISIFLGMTVSVVWMAGLLSWLAVSCLIVAVAFWKRRPELILGKTETRLFSPVCLLLNFPFLAVYWLVWSIRHSLPGKRRIRQVGTTNISISPCPISAGPLDRFDLVIDLTSEMPPFYRVRGTYLALPNLDGVPLCRFTLPHVDRNTRILVHCAQGRGRSAVMVCLLLRKLGHAKSADDAISLIRRNGARPSVSRAQILQIRSFFDVG